MLSSCCTLSVVLRRVLESHSTDCASLIEFNLCEVVSARYSYIYHFDDHLDSVMDPSISFWKLQGISRRAKNACQLNKSRQKRVCIQPR